MLLRWGYILRLALSADLNMMRTSYRGLTETKVSLVSPEGLLSWVTIMDVVHYLAYACVYIDSENVDGRENC